MGLDMDLLEAIIQQCFELGWLKKREQEIERLNNIINELEKAFKEDIKILKGYGKDSTMKVSDMINACQFYLDRLCQLRGVDK